MADENPTVLAGYWCTTNNHFSRRPCSPLNSQIPIWVSRVYENDINKVMIESEGCR